MAWKKFSLSFKTWLQLLAGTIVVLGLLSAGIWVIWEVPQKQVGSAPLDTKEKARIDAETAARVAIIQGVGGFLLFFTAGISLFNLRATQRNVLIAEEKQVTERFSKAVEMLGNENSIHIRLGGIYALERIANDSDKDYWQVMEVLTAFVRERSPYPPKPQKEEEGLSLEASQEGDEITPLPTDIQAVLTVLGRRKHSYKNGESYGLDLSETDLRGAKLQGANLQKALLSGANLQKALLSGANLQKALLLGANLQKADLWGANLQGARLEGAKLQEALLQDAKLQQAWLKEANLQQANLLGANLQKALLSGANLQEALLQEANLQQALLQEANLQKADLWGANLQQALLSGANLQQAKLQQANLQEARLEGANLQEAMLGRANLQEAELWAAKLQEALPEKLNLQGANFERANPQEVTLWAANLQEALLEGANLQGANLEGALQLRQEQLDQAKSYEGATLPEYLKKSSETEQGSEQNSP